MWIFGGGDRGVITSGTDWLLSRSLAGRLHDPRPRIIIYIVRCILLLGILWPFVADEPGYVSEDDHPHPIWNLLIFHGAVVEHVGNDHCFQQADDHEGQTHGEIDTCTDRVRTCVSDIQLPPGCSGDTRPSSSDL